MLEEIEAAVVFLTRLVAKSVDPGGKNPPDPSKILSEEKIATFSRKLSQILQNRYRNHWYPEKPSRGQAFRCIRINPNCRIDSCIEQACLESGFGYDSLRLPLELTLWIDPNEVTCRFGEHKGSFCVVAKLRDGRQENYVDQINIDELEQRSLERSKQSSFDFQSRKKRQALLQAHRAKNSPLAAIFGNAGASAAYGHHMNGSLVNGGSPGGPHGLTSSSHGPPVTQALNGFVDYATHNGMLPTTRSSLPGSYHQFNPQDVVAAAQQAATAHYVGYPTAGTPGTASSPYHHQSMLHQFAPSIFQAATSKYNHLTALGGTSPQTAGSQVRTGSIAVNTSALGGTGTFRKPTFSPVISQQNGGGAQTSQAAPATNSSHSSAKVSSAPPGTVAPGTSPNYARGLQTVFNLAAVPFTPASAQVAAAAAQASASSSGTATPTSNNSTDWASKSIVQA